jgi:hypothetical protein
MESRRAQITNLCLRGFRRQTEIANQPGVDRATGSRDLNVIKERSKEAAVRDLDEAREQELERPALIEQEAWVAWEASKKARETSTNELITGADGDRLKAGIRKEAQTGDPRYISIIQSCIDQRCKLLGLNAPQKAAPTTPDGQEPYRPTVEDFTQARSRTEDWPRERFGISRARPELSSSLAPRPRGISWTITLRSTTPGRPIGFPSASGKPRSKPSTRSAPTAWW